MVSYSFGVIEVFLETSLIVNASLRVYTTISYLFLVRFRPSALPMDERKLTSSQEIFDKNYSKTFRFFLDDKLCMDFCDVLQFCHSIFTLARRVRSRLLYAILCLVHNVGHTTILYTYSNNRCQKIKRAIVFSFIHSVFVPLDTHIVLRHKTQKWMEEQKNKTTIQVTTIQ